MGEPIDTSRLEAGLRRAARDHARERRESRERERSQWELVFWLGRFGVPVEAARTAALRDDPAALPPAWGARLAPRLDAALSTLKRQARRGDPRYDANRHIALRRLARWLAGTAAWAEASPSGEGGPHPAKPRGTPRQTPGPSRPAALGERRRDGRTEWGTAFDSIRERVDTRPRRGHH